jgi:hypothetical protein
MAARGEWGPWAPLSSILRASRKRRPWLEELAGNNGAVKFSDGEKLTDDRKLAFGAHRRCKKFRHRPVQAGNPCLATILRVNEPEIAAPPAGVPHGVSCLSRIEKS